MIAILNYEAGNVRSVQNAFARLGVETLLTDDHKVIRQADKVIFPGVGEAGAARANLDAKGLDQLIPTLTQPVLAVCVGLQLLCERSEESDTPGLGIFPVEVRRFPPTDKVPHMGWNNCVTVGGRLFAGISPQDDLYFVHSYYAETGPHTTAQADYSVPFSAAMERDNFLAVQFHPEKSGPVGARLIQNFLDL